MTYQKEPGNGLFGGDLILFESLDSTNTWAIQHASDLHNGDVVQTLSQTNGRGRFNRTWLSHPHTCLTLSVILTFPDPDDPLLLLTTQIAALAIRATLHEHALHAVLKWPNDVVVNNMKIAGVLAEHNEASGRLIVGIGLNVNISRKDLDSTKILQPATSMSIELKRECDLSEVRDTLFNQFTQTMSRTQHGGHDFIHRAWAVHDALTGRTIAIDDGKNTLTGNYEGIDTEGRLILTDNSGHRHTFWSGDISVADVPTTDH